MIRIWLCVFFLFFGVSVGHAARKSAIAPDTGELILYQDTVNTYDALFRLTNNRARFGAVALPGTIPALPFGRFDIYGGTGPLQLLGFSEYREVLDPTHANYNSTEASDPTGAHFYMRLYDVGGTSSRLGLWVRDAVSGWIPIRSKAITLDYMTGQAIIGLNSESAAADSRFKLWHQGDGRLTLTGAVDGPEGARVPMQSGGSTGGYMTFDLDQTADGQVKWLIWRIHLDGGTLLERRFLLQDLTQPIPINYMGSGSKTFVIDHPKDKARYLVHAAIEGPEARVFYRGKVRLKKGKAFVSLPNYVAAFTHLDRAQVFLQNMTGFDRVALQTQDGKRFRNGVFQIVSQNPKSTDWVSWEVSAIRRDVPPLVVEPLKSEVRVEGVGPYRYIVP